MMKMEEDVPVGEFWSLDNTNTEQIISIVEPSYKEGHRDELVFGKSGFLFKNKVSLVSAKNLLSTLCDRTNDEEKNSRIQVLENTYMKALNGDEISGATHLLEVLTLICNNDKVTALAKLQHISQILRAGKDKNNNGRSGSDDNDNGNNSHDKATQTLVKLIKENILLLFKDQYGIPHAKVKVFNHTEIMPIQSKKFEYYMSKLYFDYTNGRKVAGSESLSNAIRIIYAQTLFSEEGEKTLNLRVAWGEKYKEIIYDMTDSEYQNIRITTTNGWNIINNSDILFIRFNQRAQVTPDQNYGIDIFDQYLDLMQIKNPVLRLLIKVWTISLLIPNIPHPILILHGEKGSSKSTFCKYQKRLIDPDRIEINNIPNDKSEFVQQLHHNYLSIYDNVKYLPPWFSDEVCKAVTGGGNSKRTLYTNDDDTIYNYKRSLIVSGINNWLTETDALDRSIIIEFGRIPDHLRKEEDEIEAAFERMKPQLFAYLLDILSGALQIKSQIKLSNLPRMADFTVWGEAIARTMGYKDMEFVRAFNENIGIQNVEAIEAVRTSSNNGKVS